MDWVKLAAGLAGMLDKLSGWLKSKQDQDAGAAKQRDADNEATRETLHRVSSPATQLELSELWERNKAKFSTDEQVTH